MGRGVCASRHRMSTCHHARVAVDLPTELLEDAIRAARKALAERDDRDLTPRLKKIAGSSARQLPPPLAKQLVAELQADEVLRTEAAEQLASDAGPAATLFLTRPEGWEEGLAEEVATWEERHRSAAGAAAERRIAELERALEAAKNKAKSERARADDVATEAKRRIEDARVDIREAGRRAQRRSEELERRLVEVEAERSALAEKVVELGEELRSAREARRRAGPAPEADRVKVGTDPGQLARTLDDILERVARPHRAADISTQSMRALQLPPGIAGDSADAVEWLLQAARPQMWLVDGHNLAYRMDAGRFTDPLIRREIADVMATFRRRSLGPFRATIVFDTSASVEDAVNTGSGIDVVFVPDADAEVVRLAEQISGDAVVVSSDEEVRLAAEAAGAVTLWSDAVVSYLRD